MVSAACTNFASSVPPQTTYTSVILLLPLLFLLSVLPQFTYAQTILQDPFDSFQLGAIWQAHAGGAPDATLGVVTDGPLNFLRMTSGQSASGFRGIETISSYSLDGMSNVSVDVRLRPINQGVSGTASAVEVAIIGGNGQFIRAFASNNSATGDDWADSFATSLGSNATSGAFAHCSAGGCDSWRNYTITVDSQGASLQVKNQDGSLHPFAAAVANFTLDNLGSNFQVALRQVRSGLDLAMGDVDFVTISTTPLNPQEPDPPGRLLSAPYQQFVDGPWQVRNLPGQSRFVIASYGSPSSLPALQSFTNFAENSGLFDGIDPGPVPATHAQTLYNHIRNIGWHFTAWPGASDFQVDGGTSLTADRLAVLSTLDETHGGKTPVSFGEWGYFFHELSSNAEYFASIYPGQTPSQYAHLMKAPGSKGFDSPPVSREDAYHQVKAYYQNRQEDWDQRLLSVTGHSHYEAYAAEWGTSAVGLEIGENIRFTQSKFAFARGAARQWELPWGTQVSPWFHGALTSRGPLTGGPGTARGQDAGHSFSFYKRAWLHSWFAGAARVTPEFSDNNFFESSSEPWVLTPLGELGLEVSQIMRSHDRGVPYMPIAILIDRYSGFNEFQDRPWGVFAKTQGDQKTYDLFQHQLFPGSAASNAPNALNPEAPYMVATPYGEMFDVFLSTAGSDTLGAYPEILLVGDIAFGPDLVDSLAGALIAGSRLILQNSHIQALGTVNLSRLQASGEVLIASEWINPATGRVTAIPNALLEQLRNQHLPVVVGGEPVQYQFNRNQKGWVLELINNAGVRKVPHLPAVVDPNAVASVSLDPVEGILGAYHWLTGEILSINHEAIMIDVQPGDLEYIQFVTGIRGDLNRDGVINDTDLAYFALAITTPNDYHAELGLSPLFAGDFNGDRDLDVQDLRSLFRALQPDYNGDLVIDAADYVVWRDTLGQAGVGLAADGDGDGQVDQTDYNLLRERFGASAESVSMLLVTADGNEVAVPEPNSLLLVGGAVAIYVMHSRRRLSR